MVLARASFRQRRVSGRSRPPSRRAGRGAPSGSSAANGICNRPACWPNSRGASSVTWCPRSASPRASAKNGSTSPALPVVASNSLIDIAPPPASPPAASRPPQGVDRVAQPRRPQAEAPPHPLQVLEGHTPAPVAGRPTQAAPVRQQLPARRQRPAVAVHHHREVVAAAGEARRVVIDDEPVARLEPAGQVLAVLVD